MLHKGGVLISLAIAVIWYGYKHQATTENLQVPVPVVETSYGKLTGISGHSRNGREYFGYLGIPYAQPPVGQLRYEVSIVVGCLPLLCY